MKLYFDQNIWQYLVTNVPKEGLNQVLKSKKAELCLGLHNIYEFGRLFIDKNKKQSVEKGIRIFQYIQDIHIDWFLEKPDELIIFDLEYALGHGRILPYLDKLNITATKNEINRMALGYIDEASDFIKKREEDLLRSENIYRSILKKANPKVKKPKDFNKWSNDWAKRRQILDGSQFKTIASKLSDNKLFSDQQKYPSLNTFINAQLYFNFIGLSHKTGPSRKLVSDYRHMLTANAADIFVTDDRKAQGAFKKICSFNNLWTINEFEKFLS